MRSSVGSRSTEEVSAARFSLAMRCLAGRLEGMYTMQGTRMEPSKPL